MRQDRGRTVGRLLTAARRTAVASVATVAVLASVISADIPRSALVARAFVWNDVRAADLDPVRPGEPLTYLLIGSDRREGLPPEAGSFGELTGDRADSIALVSLLPGGNLRLLSIPRALRVRVPGHGQQKLSGAMDYGASAVLRAVRALTGARVQHVAVVDFVGLQAAVDAVHGIDLEVAVPTRDRATHLRLRAGRHRVGGRRALAYVRSRTPEELRDGRWVPGVAGDDERIRRLHTVVAATLARAQRARPTPRTLRALARLRRHIAVDRTFGPDDVAGWVATVARGRRHLTMETLPTVPQVPAAEALSPFPPVHQGTAGYLLPRQPQASAMVRRAVAVEPVRR
jgi:LCP family protein required for cell wall assembly